MDISGAYRIQHFPSQIIILPDIGAKPLPKKFRSDVVVGGRVARVPVHLRCIFPSVAPSAFEDFGALGPLVMADIAIDAILVVNVLSMLCGGRFIVVNE